MIHTYCVSLHAETNADVFAAVKGPSRLPFSSHEGLPADAMSRDYRNYDQETTELLRLAFKRRGVTFTRGMSAVIVNADGSG